MKKKQSTVFLFFVILLVACGKNNDVPKASSQNASDRALVADTSTRSRHPYFCKIPEAKKVLAWFNARRPVKWGVFDSPSDNRATKTGKSGKVNMYGRIFKNFFAVNLNYSQYHSNLQLRYRTARDPEHTLRVGGGVGLKSLPVCEMSFEGIDMPVWNLR